MTDRVLSKKVHRDGTSTIIRLVDDRPAVRSRTKPKTKTLDQIVADYQAHQARKRQPAPAAKPATSQPAAPAKRTGSINRYARHQVPGEKVLRQAKPAKKAPPAPKAYEPDTSAIIGLRRAFGLSVSAEDVDRTAKAMVQDHRAAKARKDAADKARKDAASARPEFHHGGTNDGFVQVGPLTTGNASGQPFAPMANAAVWMAVHQLFVQGERNPVSVDVNELSRMTGFSANQVRASIEALLATGQLQREPGRAGSALLRVTPVL